MSAFSPFDGPDRPTHCLKDGALIASVEVQGFYDGVAYYQCTLCKQVWDRTGKPRTSVSDVPHPVRRLYSIGDFQTEGAIK